MEEEAKGERSHEEERRGRRRVSWRPRALLGTLLAAVAIVACVDDNPAGPRARVGSAESMVGRSIDPTSCRYKRTDWQRFFYGKFDGLTGDTTTVCGTLVSVSAPPTFGDTGVAWYWGIEPDSIYISSGSAVGPYQGQLQTYITFNKPVKDVQILWGFSPQQGSTVTLYDSTGAVLAVHTNSDTTQLTRYPSDYPVFGSSFHWEVLATFTARGVRKIKLSTGGSPPGGASTRAQLFFKPDTVDCPPYNDPYLDSASVRNELNDMLVRGNFTNPNFSLRREKNTLVYKNPDGSLRFVLGTQIGVCGGPFQMTLAEMQDPTFVAVLHSHPFHNLDVAPCPGGPLSYNPGLQGGGSGADYATMNNVNMFRAQQAGYTRIRWYTVDGDKWWIHDPIATPELARASARSFPRIDVGCVRR